MSEHDARIAQTDYDFGIQIHDCSDKKDRMFNVDHVAESGMPFDPYQWDRKEPQAKVQDFRKFPEIKINSIIFKKKFFF